jgi:predicted  nucleic acid-binding Zn-ribbon protein
MKHCPNCGFVFYMSNEAYRYLSVCPKCGKNLRRKAQRSREKEVKT